MLPAFGAQGFASRFLVVRTWNTAAVRIPLKGAGFLIGKVVMNFLFLAVSLAIVFLTPIAYAATDEQGDGCIVASPQKCCPNKDRPNSIICFPYTGRS